MSYQPIFVVLIFFMFLFKTNQKKFFRLLLSAAMMVKNWGLIF